MKSLISLKKYSNFLGFLIVLLGLVLVQDGKVEFIRGDHLHAPIGQITPERTQKDQSMSLSMRLFSTTDFAFERISRHFSTGDFISNLAYFVFIFLKCETFMTVKPLLFIAPYLSENKEDSQEPEEPPQYFA